MQSAYLIQIVFDVLDDARGPIFDQIIHSAECFEDTLPLFGLGLHLGPQVLHNDVIVVPVVGVVGQNLQLAIRNVPVFIRSRFFQNRLVF